MPFIYKNADMFQQPADAIVNTVNCVGVMGKGVALQFKNRWPDNFKLYKTACSKEQIRPGKMFIFQNGDMFSSEDYKFLVNFPTKDHWRSKSKIEFIESGLEDLSKCMKQLDIKSICIPPLGCGNGGLEWEPVRQLIETILVEESLTKDIYIFEPKSSNETPEYERFLLPMTYARALLLRTLGDLENPFGGGYTKLSLQKIVYFLQVLDTDFGVKFEKNIYGPYSSNLARALINISKAGGLISTNQSSDIESVKVSAGAYASASEFLDKNASIPANITAKKLSDLISGFESPFGLELLSSVHYLTQEKQETEISSIISDLHNWSDRKRALFSPQSIEAAIERLRADGLAFSS